MSKEVKYILIKGKLIISTIIYKDLEAIFLLFKIFSIFVYGNTSKIIYKYN